ncbi:MAG: hypothetical protein Q9162_005443 [Coniocarpon cinnabarinum]
MSSSFLVANATQPEQLPPNMLDGIFPGFSIFRNIILSSLGLDIGLVVTLAALIVGLGKAASLVWSWLYLNVISYFLTTVIVNDNDDLFESFKTWASDGVISQRSRTTVAVTPWQNLLLSYDYSTSQHASSPNKVSNDSERLFNFQEAQANSRLRNELHFDATWFFFRGRVFFVQRESRERPGSISASRREEKQRFVITSIGRSRKPLMNLLEHVRKENAHAEQDVTKVVRPENRFGEGEWTTATTRTIRSLQSVIMEHEQKALVTRDLNTFIWPESAQWYASRGIPYRRGYLFSGPPGTGKTSLAFALSGLFGLKLHVLSLTDKTITDSSLLTLFCNLPDRCIVLLEDVDAAGLGRDNVVTGQDESDEGGAADDDDEVIGFMTPEKEPSKSKVSLSGLLNAIDGVATHEGRVIIMTSNCPEELDPALIRPGRIDEHIRFNLATHDQISELFLAMYSSNPQHATDSQTLGTAIVDIKNAGSRVSDVPGYSMDELREMSVVFAHAIPESYFSPAEIQNFLLPQDRRCDPRAALEQIEFWVWKTKSEKENKTEDGKKPQSDKEDKGMQTKDIENVSASKASLADLCDGDSGVKTPETDDTAVEEVDASGEVKKIVPEDTKIQEIDERAMVDKVEPEFAAGKISLDSVENGDAWSRPLSRHNGVAAAAAH